ncbi:hypothetical protein [Streptomyces sp. NPDC002133]|uniref:hypothetical protein n=1 Tax=Streptomyces sp. NPDC002133 TaxID=3154409 RepID=UPI00332817C4
MGAKTAVLAYADVAVADVLQGEPESDCGRAAALVARVRPGQSSEEDGEEPWE